MTQAETIRFIVRNERVRGEATHAVESIKATDDTPMEVVIRPYKERRRLEQLAYLFGVVYEHIRFHLAECGMTEEIYSSQDIHEYLARKFMPTKVVEVNGETIIKRWSASGATVKELSQHIEHCIRWAAEIGCIVPPSVKESRYV